MKDIWFVEERHMDRWSPCVYHGDKPDRKRPDVPKRVFRADPVKVKPEHRGLNTKQLTVIYGRPKNEVAT